MRKHIFSLLLCFSMMMILLPMTAFAADPEVIIGGVTVDTSADWYATTDENGVVTVCDSTADWNIKVIMDTNTAVVTLNNATIDNYGHEAIKTTDCDLHIILTGDANQIGLDSSGASDDGIAPNGKNVTIDGEGDLTIKGNNGINVNGSGNVSIDITGSLNITSNWQSIKGEILDAKAKSIYIDGFNGYNVSCESVSLTATQGNISVGGSGQNAITAYSGAVSVSADNGTVTLSGNDYAVYNDGRPVSISAGNDVKLTGSVYGSSVSAVSDSGDVTIDGHFQAIGYVSGTGSVTISAENGDVYLTSGDTSNIISGSYGYTLNITAGGKFTAEGGYGIANFGIATVKADVVSVRLTDNGYGLVGGSIYITNPDNGNCSSVYISGGAGGYDAINICNVTINSDLVKIIAADDAVYAIRATGAVNIDDAGVIVGPILIQDADVSDFINPNVIRAAVYGGDAGDGLNLADVTPTESTYYVAGDGYAVWKPDSKTLILHGATIINKELLPEVLSECGIALPSGDITIVVEGTNEITSYNAYGIRSVDANVTLEGNGTLNASSTHTYGIALIKDTSINSLSFTSDTNVTLSGIVYVENGDTNKTYTIYGDVAAKSGSSWEGAVTIADGATVTIPEDSTLWLNKASSITNNGQIVNDGTIILPYDYTTADIEALNITGDGTIELFDEATSKFRVYINGSIYAYGGDSNVDLSTVPTEVTYFEAGNGYIIFTPDDATLTLHNVDSLPDISLPNSPITMLLEGENKVNHVTVNNSVTVDGNGTLDATYIDCTAEGSALSVNSGATLNALCETISDGVTTFNVYGSYLSDSSYNLGGNYKMALKPGAVFTMILGSGIEFCENSTLNEITFGEGSEIVNNGFMILPLGTTPEQIAALPLSGTGVVYVATAYNVSGDPEEQTNPYTNDGVALNNVVLGDLTLGYTEVTAEDNLGYTWLKTGEGADEVWTLTLDNTYIDGNLRLPDGTIVINTVSDSNIWGSISASVDYPCDLTFTGSGSLNIGLDVNNGQGGEVTIAQGAYVTLAYGLNVGESGGVNGVLIVNGTLTASAPVGVVINTGSLKIGSKGVLNVSGEVGIKLNGMNSEEGTVYDDAFVIFDGGTLNANCTNTNIEVFTSSDEATEENASDVIVLPDGYMPSGYLIRIVSGENGGTQYAYTIAKTNAALTLEAEQVYGAGGKLTLKKSSNNDNHHSNSGGGSVLYVLTFDTNGGSKISKEYKDYGTVIKLSDYQPTLDGYDFDGWYSDEKLTDKVTSVKLTGNTTVYAKWTEKADDATDTTVTANPFNDVSDSDYYHDAVIWAIEKGITSGTTDTTFSPNKICTRAQTVTLLWKAKGSPEPVSSFCSFTDVANNAYYYKAVLWAVENGITSGTTSTTFS
ncbi:MAG: S-layer homology domain-containing protein, partial [Candidatus Metalachnospira sp.]|nr:S-layer homology domain-containing protein [Candidatus Metalachnospira sp.]